MARPTYIEPKTFREYYGLRELDRQFKIGSDYAVLYPVLGGSLKVSTYVRNRGKEGRPVKSRGGKFRPVDVWASARAEGLRLWPLGTEAETEALKEIGREMSEASSRAHSRLIRIELEIEQKEVELGRLERELDELSEAIPMALETGVVHSHWAGLRPIPLSELRSAKFELDEFCGVYFLWRGNEVVYVGQSRNWLGRINNHRLDRDKDFDSFSVVRVPPENLYRVEQLYITFLSPEYNKMGKPPEAEADWDNTQFHSRFSGILSIN